jgi:hypothetical protein
MNYDSELHRAVEILAKRSCGCCEGSGFMSVEVWKPTGMFPQKNDSKIRIKVLCQCAIAWQKD